jgi:RimJ/RimL family protein N-acetyltransferase
VEPVVLDAGLLRLRPWRAADADVARGRGMAAVAVDTACRRAFAALPVDRIELCHALENTASGRVAQKAGFTCEGRLRRSFRYGDGRKHDELLWTRLADDPVPVVSIRS